MNAKQYEGIWKHLSLEHELAEKEKVVDAFVRVQKGERFSLHDLEVVKNELIERQGKLFDEEINMHGIIHSLEKDISSSKDNVSLSRRRLKKRGVDLERLRRQMRLQQERIRQEGIEKVR